MPAEAYVLIQRWLYHLQNLKVELAAAAAAAVPLHCMNRSDDDNINS